MLDFEIIAARYDEANNRIEVIKEITDDDGTMHLNLHMFSGDILECRAAEYDIDDIDTLINIVIHEPFIDGTDVYQMSAKDARNTHLQKIEGAKTKQRVNKLSKFAAKAKLASLGIAQKYLDSVDDDYMQVIRNNCNFDAAVISVNKEYVAKERLLMENKEPPNTRMGRLETVTLREKLLRESTASKKPRNLNTATKANNVDKTANHIKMVMRKGKLVKE